MENSKMQVIRTPDNTFEITNISEEQMEYLVACVLYSYGDTLSDISEQYENMGYSADYIFDKYVVYLDQVEVCNGKIVDVMGGVRLDSSNLEE